MERAEVWSRADVERLARLLSEAISARRLPRRDRGVARRLLAEAFNYLEQPAPQSPASLCRAMDDLLHPRVPLIPRPVTIGLRFVQAAVNEGMVERLIWPLEMVDARLARIERFLSVTRMELKVMEDRQLSIVDDALADPELTRG